MIKLDRFTPRDYQLDFFENMEGKDNKYRHALIVHPRRSGKDYMAFHYAVRCALRKTTTVLYMLKSYSQAKQVIWDMISNDGIRLLDTIPPEVIESKNSSELVIKFRNGSQIRLGSAENYEKSIVGSNASLIIFSEYGTYDNDNPFLFASPILAANNGRFVFISTPRGRNFYYDLWMKAKNWPDWYCELKTVDDTQHISEDMMQIIEREHSFEFIQQEYYCSFSRGIEGAVYARYIEKMRDEGRICHLPYDPKLPVSTAWDLGIDDSTSIVLYQLTKNNLIHVIDFYENNNQPMTHYIKWLKDQEYVYDKHFAPHDADIREYSTGLTRIEYAADLGLYFETKEVDGKLKSATPKKSVVDGVESVRVALPRMFIDQRKCVSLIKALESYHRAWDDEKKTYSKEFKHDWSSHAADAARYMCLTLDQHDKGMTEEDARRSYMQAMWGEEMNARLPEPFMQDKNNYLKRGW